MTLRVGLGEETQTMTKTQAIAHCDRLRGHKFLTAALVKALPALGTTDGQGDDVKVQAKFFHPFGIMTWYLTEYDPSTGQAFGWVFNGDCSELGYIDTNELATILHRRLPVERDCWWTPKTLREVKASHGM